MQEPNDGTLQEPLLEQQPANHLEDENGDATPPRRRHRNIPVMLAFQFIRCGAESIWLGSVLSAYVYLIKPRKPELIGYLSAVEGIVQFFAACAAGVLADKYRRDILCQVASIFGIAASLLIVGSTTTHIFWFLVVALALNGAFDGINLTAGLAVFADSIEEGQRSHYFTQRTLSMTIGQIMGPLCGLVMFYAMGDQWTIESCAFVMCTAQVLLSPSFVLLWFFKDVEHTEEDERQDTTDEDGPALPLLQSEESEHREVMADQTGETRVDNDVAVDATPRCATSPRFIAICAATSDIMCAFSSGISFRYFAIFFLKDLHFNPVLVQVLDALSCLVGGGLLLGAQRVSIRLGRSITSVLFKTIGVAFLLSMVFSFKYIHQGGPPSENRALTVAICLFYLLQEAFLNSTQALTRSLIMDNVPRNERAKWSALESINIFGWCGSAAVGGILVKMFDGNILPVFGLTAGLQVLGLLPLVLLFGIDTHEGQENFAREAQEGSAES